ncbi:ATP-binding protein [Shewanella waksmanii]|uniref:hybrid sensor histidine kinase/response regulator n=1 Tax=Shewanella waksmanii TaxID=213783 RepID=UPI003736156F
MKFSPLTYIAFAFGLIITLLINVTLWQNSQDKFDKFYENKANSVFNASKEMLMQHRIMMDALRSFFNASTEVTKAEFTLFAKDLLKIKSAVAFTLDTELRPKYLSDPNFQQAVENGQIGRATDGSITYQVKDFATIVIEIDEPKHPYLVYAVSHQRIQERINEMVGICEKFTLGSDTLINQECQKLNSRQFKSVFGHHSEVFIDLPEYNTSYSLALDYIPTEQEILSTVKILIIFSLIGLSFSILLASIVQHRVDKEKSKIETNSKLALLSTLNHEIRTPINAVLGYANMLKQHACCSDDESQTLDKMIWSANLLNNVAQNTLTYSKASAGTLSLHYEPTDLHGLLTQINDYYHAFADTHKKQLLMRLPTPMPAELFLDSTKLFQLSTNFINNAFKYSSGDKVIYDVKVLPLPSTQPDTPGFIRVAIKDFGKGMSKHSMDAIKRPFTIDTHSDTALKSGIGIGLYTCKCVLESVGGSIKIRSQKGRGTLVIFRFPYKISQSKTIMADRDSAGNNDEASSLSKPNKVTTPTISAQQPSLAARTNVQQIALVVDDNCFNLEVCKSMLESVGYRVYTAKDEPQALTVMPHCYQQAINNNSQLIVLMDYMLDNTDGLTLIARLKEQGYHHAQYFILSANSEDEIPDASKTKQIHYLQKPLDINSLNQAIMAS